MSKHKGDREKQAIAGLFQLGRALGYYVKDEDLVTKYNKSSQAIDVTWQAEENHVFPLMIFEVESGASNTDGNNPLKIYGKTNQMFEKPLFFFHIIISGGQNSVMIEDLRRMYGFHNYRLYRFSLKEKTTLLKDIFSQHRRISRYLDLLKVVPALKHPTWQGIDIEAIIFHIEELCFECNRAALSDYAALSKYYPELLKHYLYHLKNICSSSNTSSLWVYYSSNTSSYRLGYSYFGSILSSRAEGIHLGILTSNVPVEQKQEYFQKLKQLQERYPEAPYISSSSMSAEIMYKWAGPLLAVIAALMRDVPEAGLYLAQQCNYVLVELEIWPSEISLFTALWTLYIAASSELAREEFEVARQFINERGGIPRDSMYEPPGTLSIDDKTALSLDISSLQYVPNLEDFKRDYKAEKLTLEQRRSEATFLAIDSLLKHDAWKFWSATLVHLLLA